MCKQTMCSDPTYSNHLILSTSSEIAAIRTEANAANVQIGTTHWVHGSVVLQNANLFTTRNIVNLSRPVATSGNIFAVMAESHTANNAIVCERVDQIDIENSRDLWVKNSVPVGSVLLIVRGNCIKLQLTKSITNRWRGSWPTNAMFGGGVADLGRLRAARVRNGSINLWCRGPSN